MSRDQPAADDVATAFARLVELHARAREQLRSLQDSITTLREQTTELRRLLGDDDQDANHQQAEWS